MGCITDKQFQAMLRLMMVSDPWPLSQEERDRFERVLTDEAQDRGWETWIEAYHNM